MMRGQHVSSGPAGGATPAQNVTTIAPTADRSMIVLWLGVALIAAAFLAATLSGLVAAATGKSLRDGFAPGTANPRDLVIQAGMVVILYVIARISDTAGNMAVLFLVALWIVWIYRHAAAIGAFFSRA